jgi:hypothetical protein
MITLFTDEEYKNAKYKDKLPLQCIKCNKIYYKYKEDITQALKPNAKKKYNHCSRKCYLNSITHQFNAKCTNCGIEFKSTKSRNERSKQRFCSHKCNGIYQSKNKKHGSKRSKLEIWLEAQLTTQYPNIEFHFNKKDAIGSELDIYIPALSLAFELNGIFHYEPIYGDKKLNNTIKNDQNKFKSCIEHQIDLCVIDTSHQLYFKENTSKKYLDVITNIINQRTI